MAARATVIIPTYSDARFGRWAVKSVQEQTIADIEICIICDGSPPEMVAFFDVMAKEDPRIKVFSYPKSPRTGEPYRHEVIRKTTGRIVCYCGHDDLWLPDHVETVEKALQQAGFTHTLHAVVDTQQQAGCTHTVYSEIYLMDLKKKKTVKKMRGGQNYFGLTYGAHTRTSYQSLTEGWVTTPDRDIPTDLYMWNKFLAADGVICTTTKKITALSFPLPYRRDWSQQRRDEELARYFVRLKNPGFIKNAQKILPNLFWIKLGRLKKKMRSS